METVWDRPPQLCEAGAVAKEDMILQTSGSFLSFAMSCMAS